MNWLNGDSEAAKRVAETLQASGFSLTDIAAHAITVMAVELERIDLQVERHESWRDSLLRQIERRREGWEKRVQRASEDVIEAEFSEIATGGSETRCSRRWEQEREVTSQRQRAANRANAAKSTGPRTKAGRAKASQNAWRHGLATALRSEPGVVEEIERIAHAIVVEAGRPDLIEYARRVAEAEIDLRRVRRARETLARLPTAAATSYRLVRVPQLKTTTGDRSASQSAQEEFF